MKKILYSVAAMALAFFSASCQQENLEPVAGGTTVTYTVNVPDAIATKADDGVTKLIYEVYRAAEVADLSKDPIYKGEATLTSGTASLELEFVKNQKFTVLFWAQNPDVTAYGTEDLRAVTLTTSLTANDADLAVFAGSDDVEDCVSKADGNVSLVRPVSQINIATSPESLKVGTETSYTEVVLKKSSATVKKGLYKVYNVADKTVSEASDFEYTSTAVPAGPITVGTKEYTYVAMNYVGFAPETGATVDVDFTIVTSEGDIEHSVSSVPVKANYKTNIIGNLITATDNYQVTLGTWATEETNVEIWDGKTISTPDFDATTQTWTIDNGAELAWFAHAVNRDLPSTVTKSSGESTVPAYSKDHKAVLGAHIQLGGHEWTTIGTKESHFMGSFDGAGYSINGLKISECCYGEPQAALFGTVSGSPTIKNLTINDAEIVMPAGHTGDFYAAGLIGTFYGNLTITNVTVQNSKFAGNNKVAGLLAHDGVCSSLNIDKCHVLNCEIASTNAKDGGNVGGLIGLFQGVAKGTQAAPYGDHIIKNSSVKECTINAINSTNTGKRSNGEFVACLSGKENQTLVITDCVVEGNTFSQIFNGTDPVTYVSPYGVFVGGNRNDDGKGTVIVNGCVAVDGYPNLFKHVESGEYMIYDLAGLKDFHAYLQANTGRHPYDRVYNIMNNIDAADWTWNSINVINDAGDAKGLVLDGKEHTISNLKIAGEGMLTSASAGSVIKNITMDKATVTSTGHNAAIFWGSVYSSVSFEKVHVKNSTINGLCNAGAFVGGTYEPNNLIVTFKNCSVEASEIIAEGYNGQDPTGASGFLGKAYGSTKVVFSETNAIDEATTITNKKGLVGGKVYGYTIYVGDWEGTGFSDKFDNFDGVKPVAKVNNAEYYTIDKAIANWTNNSTLTLLANVTLSDVVTLKSTEYHILDLSTFTMTAANGKDAIQITNEGRASASYALDIKADATNPGGISATGKTVVKTTGKSGVQDRPIIRFYNGVFNASNIINHAGSNGTNSPQFIFYNGVYNGNISTNRAICIFEGGTFNGRFYMSVDSSSYARIGGGKFKELKNNYGSSLNSSKLTIGSSKGVFDRGVYVDDDGYIVVEGPVITEFGDKFEAKATNIDAYGTGTYGSYLPYSSVPENGLYYKNAEMALSKHGQDNVVLPTPAPKSNEIWYTSDENVIVTPTTLTAFGGANILSNEYDSDNSVYIIKFDKPISAIGNDAFKYSGKNNWMTSIKLPNGVTSIGDWAFYMNQSLLNVTIPKTVTSIGDYAFGSCYDLNTIICKPTTPPNILASTFNYLQPKDITVIVPAATVDVYKADSNWRNFNIVAE